MNARIKIVIKTPDNRRGHLASKVLKAEPSPSTNSPIGRILHLQRTIGNQAVQRLIKSKAIQARLKINQRGDIHEQETDKVTEQMLNMPENTAISKNHEPAQIEPDRPFTRDPSRKERNIIQEKSRYRHNESNDREITLVNALIPAHKDLGPHIMRDTHTFSLTFDDGPHSATLGTGANRTENVLDTLKSKGIKAGFFVQTAAVDVKDYKFRGSTLVGMKLIKRMSDEGHTVGIHTGGTKEHELHTEAQKAGRLEKELTSAKEFIKTQTGKEPTFVRPPKGKHDEDVLKTYAKVGLSLMLWDIEGDKDCTSEKDLKEQMSRELRRIAKASWKHTTPSKNLVILYHDVNPNTSKNLDVMLDYTKKETEAISKEMAKKAEKGAADAKKGAETAEGELKSAEEELKRAKLDMEKATTEKDIAAAKKRVEAAEKKVKAAKKKAETVKKQEKIAREKAEETKKHIGTAEFAPL